MPIVTRFLGVLLAIITRAHHAQAQDSQNTTLCGTSDFYNSTDSSVPYSFNNNAWGANGNAWGAGNINGYSCLSVSDGGRKFSVTYKWEGDASTVKGFPYMKPWPSNLPVQLWNVSSLPFSAKYNTYVAGVDPSSPGKQAVAYDDIGLRANVAVDMFLSDNITNSTGLGPPIEIMIWPWYTPNVLPLGHAESTPDIDTIKINGTKYSLYHGFNIQGQHVFSWLAHENVTEINVDYAPLLKYIVKKGLLGGGLYLGQLEFGTEVMNANDVTTFVAWDYSLRVIRQGDPDDPNLSTATPTAASTATPKGTQISSTMRGSAITAGATAIGTSSSAAGALSCNFLSLMVNVLLSGIWIFLADSI